jgi:hypothetical protein
MPVLGTDGKVACTVAVLKTKTTITIPVANNNLWTKDWATYKVVFTLDLTQPNYIGTGTPTFDTYIKRGGNMIMHATAAIPCSSC